MCENDCVQTGEQGKSVLKTTLQTKRLEAHRVTGTPAEAHTTAILLYQTSFQASVGVQSLATVGAHPNTPQMNELYICQVACGCSVNPSLLTQSMHHHISPVKSFFAALVYPQLYNSPVEARGHKLMQVHAQC